MRSEPLILKKNGNLKYPKSVQKGKDKMRWRLVVTDFEGKNKGKKVRRYSDAKRMIETLIKKHPDSEYTIVSRQVGYGPPASKISDEHLTAMNERGRWWCPYCRKFRVFEWDEFWNVTRCPICRVFMNNSHVIRNNPLVIERMD